jgi:MFS family permease
MPSEGSSRAAFRHRNFRFYLPARFLVTISSEMQSLAVGWQIYSLTHRPLDLGLAGLAQFLPGICLFLVAGQTADRVSRRRILQFCYASFCVCSLLLLGITVSGNSSKYAIYSVLLLNGAVRAFNMPASQAFVPLLVPADVFPNAVAWSSSVFQTATVAGPMLGGVLYAITGSPTFVYSCAAISYLVAFVFIGQVSLVAARAEQRDSSSSVVFQGLAYIWKNKQILGAISLDLFAVLLGGAVALLPVYANEILRIGTIGLGMLRSAPGLGAVLMGILVAHRPIRRRAGAVMLSCIFAFGIFTVVFGVSRNFAVSLAALLLIGAADTVSVIIRHTLIQLSTPDHMRGRVSAVNMIFIGASNEVGQFESGITAQWFGAVPAVVLGGVGTMLIVVLWARFFPNLRQLDRIGIPS